MSGGQGWDFGPCAPHHLSLMARFGPNLCLAHRGPRGQYLTLYSFIISIIISSLPLLLLSLLLLLLLLSLLLFVLFLIFQLSPHF